MDNSSLQVCLSRMSRVVEYEISVDTGGTFTDVVLRRSDGKWQSAKTPTTSYDLARCFFSGIEAAAQSLGVEPQDVLERTTRIVYATTLGTNTLIQRSGPVVGVITTAGLEDTLAIMRGRGAFDLELVGGASTVSFFERPQPLASRSRIVGAHEEISPNGEVLVELEEDEARRCLQDLLDKGVDAIAVCLRNGHVNPTHEHLVRRIAREEYPAHLLGSVPIFVSSDIASYTGEYGRMNATVVNAYLHRPLARFLYPLEEELRRRRYHSHPLLILANNGGTSRVAKTTAVRTWNSGPAAGVLGASALAETYDIGNIICADVGGTSFDIAIVRNLEPPIDREPIVEGGLRLTLPVIATTAVGSGGGTIARVDVQTGELRLGPESAEAIPGPACFGLGGEEPTVTDADVVLGILDPETFLGGQFPLSPERAHDAIRQRIAEPLGIDVYAAATRIRQGIQAQMALRLRRELDRVRVSAAEAALLAYGGAGPTHMCGVARTVGCSTVIVTAYSSVLSAVGAGLRPVEHIYESETKLLLDDDKTGTRLRKLVNAAFEEAMRDMRVEGFQRAEIGLKVDAELASLGQRGWFAIPEWYSLETVQLVPELLDRTAASEADSRSFYRDKSFIVGVRVRASAGKPRDLVLGANRVTQKFEEREAREIWLGHDRFACPVRELNDMPPGEQLEGPAIVELPESTCFVDPGFAIEVDEFGTGWIRQLEEQSMQLG